MLEKNIAHGEKAKASSAEKQANCRMFEAMKSSSKGVFKFTVVVAVILFVPLMIDYLVFGGFWTGVSYSLWSWQAHWKLAFWLPLVIFVCGLLMGTRYWLKAFDQRDQGNYSKARTTQSTGWLCFMLGVVFTIASSVTLIYLQDGSRKMAVLKQAKITRIDQPIAINDKRRLPLVVAKQAAQLRYNRPNYRLTDIHLVKDCSGQWVWSMVQTPKRNWMRSTGGLVQISAENASADARSVKVVNTNFKYGPEMHVRDGLTYQLRKKIGRDISSPETVAFVDCSGRPGLLSPIMKLQNAGSTRFMSQVGVAVTRPGGEISSFTMAEASKTAWLAATGRIVASQQATAVAESYRYVNGRSNQSLGILGFINKGDQKGRYDTMDTGDQNSQPYLLQGINGQSYWVTMLRPYRSGRALGGIIYTNSVSGKSMLWLSPVDKEGVGTASVIGPDAAMGFSDIQTPYINTARLVSTEPRLFVSQEGKLSYVVALSTRDYRRVVAAVAVDSLTGEPTALFNYQRNPQAEQQLGQFIKSGKPPEGTSLRGQADTGLSTEAAPKSTSPSLTSAPLTPLQLQVLMEACKQSKACSRQLLK